MLAARKGRRNGVLGRRRSEVTPTFGAALSDGGTICLPGLIRHGARAAAKYILIGPASLNGLAPEGLPLILVESDLERLVGSED